MKTSIHICLPAFFHKKNPKGYINLLKIQVGLKLCRRSYFNSRCIRFKDPDYPDKVYKVVKALYGLHQDPRAWYETLANYLLENGFQRGKIDQTLFIKKKKGDILLVQVYVDDNIFGLQVKQKPDGIFISQNKYVAEILRKFSLTDGKSASTPIDTENPLLKDPDVKRIFRYLKGKPHLGLWYPKDSSFNLVAYSDSDYAGASLDRKSTTGGCQFFGCLLISWQCKKQTVVATSSTKAEYVAAASCYAQVLWIQNQLLDYGLKFLLFGLTNCCCSLNAVRSPKLSRMGYENPSTKFTFYKAFFSPQWKFLIHNILQCMSAKRTLWNEFSSSMASAVICLSTGRSLVRNVDSSSKFYMYLRFLQLMIRAQVGDLSSHTTKYSSPTLTQKVFANMRRVGKGFSRVETPLFKGMIVAQQADDVADEAAAGVDVDVVPAATAKPSIPSPTPTTQPPHHYKNYLPLHRQDSSISGDHQVKTKGKEIREEKQVESVRVKEIEEDLEHADKDLSMQDDGLEPTELKEVVEVVTTSKLMTEVVTAAAATITASTTLITTAAPRIMVEEPKPLKKQAQIEQAKAYARELEAELNKNINLDDVIEQVQRKEKEDNVVLRNMAGFKMDYFKGMRHDDIRPIFKKYFNSTMAFLEKTKEQMEEEDIRALKRKTESFKEKAAKKQKLDEEVEELKKHLQIVPNDDDDDDDVYTKATPLALMVLVVDYEIYTENNKPYYKIIRDDGTHQLFLSFLSLLRNFDREDLEVLWQLVKERFASSKPKNFSYEFLLTTLTYMFEKPNVQA
nr:hypothetical protein [Tanacetum cinerariifolium]